MIDYILFSSSTNRKSRPNVSGNTNNESNESVRQIPPTMSAAFTSPIELESDLNERTIGTVAPRTKLGTVVVTVARMLVPKVSDAIVTNNAQ